jgi:hypothetical protein
MLNVGEQDYGATSKVHYKQWHNVYNIWIPPLLRIFFITKFIVTIKYSNHYAKTLVFIISSMIAFVVMCGIHDYITM